MEEYHANIEMINATMKPVVPTSVSITVQVFSVVVSSIPTNDLTSQKPESLKWEQTVEPPAMAAVVQYNSMQTTTLILLLSIDKCIITLRLISL